VRVARAGKAIGHPVPRVKFSVLATEPNRSAGAILLVRIRRKTEADDGDILHTERTIMRLTTLAAVLLTSALAAPTQVILAQGRSDSGIKWGPAPAVFPAGAQMAVMQGDPGGTGLFTVRLRLPNGYKIPPHMHPTDENVTVLSGSFSVGMGKSFEAGKMMKLSAGGFVTAPANEAHYAMARGVTVVQVHAMGPFAMTYVNPADTPKAATQP
jgi:quercetin dioxygenase-like cupin family protein